MGMDEKIVVIKKNSVGSFLQGIMLGGALALLLAPRSGRETREIITERGYEFRDKASEIAKDTRSRAEHALHDVRNKVDESVKSVKEGASENIGESRKQLKRELEIMDDVNNPEHPL
jgi:gas vesicle protein